MLQMLYPGPECQILWKCRVQELWHSFQDRNSRNYSLLIPASRQPSSVRLGFSFSRSQEKYRTSMNVARHSELLSQIIKDILIHFISIFLKEQICIFSKFQNWRERGGGLLKRNIFVEEKT